MPVKQDPHFVRARQDVRLKNLADDKEIPACELTKGYSRIARETCKLSEAVRRHGGDFETYPCSPTETPSRASFQRIW